MTAAAMTAGQRRPLVPCSVVIRQPGMTSHYEGLFRSTCDAVIDAMDRFPDARGISVSHLHPPVSMPRHTTTATR